MTIEDLSEYFSVAAMQDGILYGYAETESGLQFASYDASGLVYLHGAARESQYYYNNFFGDYVCCFAGKKQREFYISKCYITENGNEEYLYSFSPETPLQKIKLGEVGSFLLGPKAVGEDVVYLYKSPNTNDNKGISSLIWVDTTNGKRETFLEAIYDTDSKEGEIITIHTYCEKNKLVYAYVKQVQGESIRYYLRSYDLEGNLQKEFDLTEIAEEINKTAIYRMTVEDDVLFMNNFSLYSIFIDLGGDEPELLLSNTQEDDCCYEESFGAALSQPVSIYVNRSKNILMFFNRKTKQFVKRPASAFGIKERISRLCVDRTGDVLIRSCDENDNYYLYFGTLKDGLLTDVHPCRQSDLSYRLEEGT